MSKSIANKLYNSKKYKLTQCKKIDKDKWNNRVLINNSEGIKKKINK
jgi:hypothetical protein